MRAFELFPPGQEGFVACSYCLEQNAPEDVDCHICGEALDVVSEDDIFGIYGHAPDDGPLGVFGSKETDTDVATVTRTNSLHCIQCDSPFDECGCGMLYLSFDEALMDVFEAGVDAYDPVGACDSCVFAFSPHCQPLRGWLRVWIENRERVEDQQLTGCEDYRSY